jgi:beta-lactam-binding protein with PASTA domain
LTFNASEKPEIQLPNLIDKSVRYVYAIFKLKRLNIGEITYVDDIAHNVVLELYYNGKKITENQMIPIESSIDLIVGKNKNETEVPDICNISLNESIVTLLDSCLKLGNIEYIETTDSELNNIVVSQSLNKKEMVQIGSVIDVSVYKLKKNLI